MIALLRGRVASFDTEWVVVETAGGVGYQVFCHLRTMSALRELREDVALHVHTSVSADAIRLFGFTTREELRLFRLLLGVERIGPKAALGILGRAELPILVRAIRGGDAALVGTVPGIGPKTAQRVLLELKGRLDDFVVPGETPVVSQDTARTATLAVDGLRGLGFRESEARSAVSAAAAALGPDAELGDLVAAALRHLDAVLAP